MNIIVTGGAGFIGSALIRFLINQTSHNVYNIDKLTYAANLQALDSIKNDNRYHFFKEDILNRDSLAELFDKIKPDLIFHLAAESHVDNSIESPMSFVETNITGTASLLVTANLYYDSLSGSKRKDFKFLHISTDEVYGDLEEGKGFFTEDTPYNPSSPYSASKASSDHLVRAWIRTYNFPALITNCSNNYGPFQFIEKLIPKTITNAINKIEIPVYGDGSQIRDWLHVDDHVEALYEVISHGRLGETYNIGGNNEVTNLEVINLICDIVDKKINKHHRENKSAKDLIKFVTDRPGHDLRYAIDSTKIKTELGWIPKKLFSEGLNETIDWYINYYK